MKFFLKFAEGERSSSEAFLPVKDDGIFDKHSDRGVIPHSLLCRNACIHWPVF